MSPYSSDADVAVPPRYSEPEKFDIVQVPLPELRDDDVLVKVKACGVCGTGKTYIDPKRLPLEKGVDDADICA